MSSWKHLREEGRHFAKKHRVGAKRALVGVLIAAMTISTMNVPAIAEELGITADAQEQIIQDSTVNTENQSATAEGTPAEGTGATVNEGDDPADTSADAATDTTADTQSADDQQPDEAAGTESDQNNLTGGGSSENDPAAVEEDTTAQVAVKVANASLKYTDANGAEQTVSENKDAVDFPTQTEIKFSVTANDGFQASRVFYTVGGVDADVDADESGTYTIPAEAVNDGLAITVETAEIPAADEPAADDAAGEADGVATLTINVENSTVTLTNAEGEEQTLTESQDVQVAEGKDLSLTVQPDDGYEIEDVVVSDGESELAVKGEDGAFSLSAGNIVDGGKVSVETSSVQSDAVDSLSMKGSGTEEDPFILAPGESSDRIYASFERGAQWGLENEVSWEDWSRRTEAGIESSSSNLNGTYAIVKATNDAKHGDEFSLRYYIPGWFGNDDVIKEVYFCIEESAERTVTFHANGGSGDEVSWTVEPSDGSYAVSLPSPSDIGISNEGKVFAGWSENQTGNGNNYVAGLQFALSKQSTDLYAIWIDPEAVTNNTAYFYIRADGVIQFEPAEYGKDDYYPKGGQTTLQGKLHTPVAVNNNLDAVDANLAQLPSDSQIQDMLATYGVSFDPSSKYIEWYVIKVRDAAKNTWNVDGVIRDKSKNEVAYHPNGGNENVPGSNEYAVGEEVAVDFSKTPTRVGYTFIGWDEDRNATDPKYVQGQEPDSFEMPDKDVNLYAIWRANNSTEYKVEVYYQANGEYGDPEVKTLANGTTDQTVSVKAGYAFDESQGNVLSATCAGDGSTVLKVYYKQQFTVTYQPGDHAADGSQAQSTGSLDWGAKTPEAPVYEGAPGYSFAGWSTEVAETVTGDVTYVAQWTPNTNTEYKVEER